MDESVAGLVRTGSLDAHDSVFGPVAAREANVSGGTVGLLAAGRIQAKEVRALALIGGQVDGDIQTVLTPLTAFLAGAGFALTLFGLRQLTGQKRKK
jgi:hypothetical protein